MHVAVSASFAALFGLAVSKQFNVGSLAHQTMRKYKNNKVIALLDLLVTSS